jgi:hypothetical protein
MRRRYVSWVDIDPDTGKDLPSSHLGDQQSITVHEPEPIRRKTGLLDAKGQPLLSVEEMDPIGFVRF